MVMDTLTAKWVAHPFCQNIKGSIHKNSDMTVHVNEAQEVGEET